MDQGIFDSGCSSHITGNKSYLTDYQDVNGGFVAFAGNPKGGKITGKGKIRTRKLDFKDVYFVKELKFNLFSVLQMCDKKNSVLFTKTECLVLSPDFKLLDESQVLLKVRRQDNMYSFDLKNVVPSGGETLLEAYLQSFLKTTILVLLVRRESNTKPLNRVLVTKPHNKTPYELLLGRPPSISFMRPFGCPVTILNTLDPLGKFDGKANEGFLVGYSINSKNFRVFNTRTRKSTDNKDADEVPGKGDDDLSKRNDQERIDSSTQDVNTAGPSINTASENINTGSSNINTASPILNDPSMQSLETTGIFDDAYDDREEMGVEADLNNLEITMNVSSIPTTRIHKDHPIEQIIGDLHSAPLTRRMSQQNLE
ncbi:ribonuclease H-like domain-containing protein [Tanacetum coccineum]